MSDNKINAQYQVKFVDANVLRPLRHEVLRPGLGYETTDFEGDREPTTLHAAVYDAGGEVIGIGSILVRSWKDEPQKKAFQLRGMASSAKHRGSGAGKIALKALEDKAREEHASVIWCNARISAAGFYSNAGWKIVSPEFEIEGVGPHFTMLKNLT